MRAESPLYAPRAATAARSPHRRGRRRRRGGRSRALAILVGLAFAGSRSELAPGTEVAGIDVGGLTKREAVAKLDALFEQTVGRPGRVRRPATSSYSFAANQLGVQPDWSAAVAAAGRAGRRLRPAARLSPHPRPRVRRRGAPAARGLECRARVRARPDRRGRRIVARGARRSCVVDSGSGSFPSRRAASSTVRPRPRSSFAHSVRWSGRRARRSLPVRVTAPSVSCRRCSPAPPSARAQPSRLRSS